MPEKLFTAKEAADYLGITEKEVESLVSKGKLTAYKIGGAFLRFKQENLDALQAALRGAPVERNTGFIEGLADFLHFNDFYIISILLIILLIAIIIYF